MRPATAKQAHTTYQQAQATYSKAAKAELNRDLDRAFQLYVKAAEDFLHAGQSPGDSNLRKSCKEDAGRALERAEKIKVIKPDISPITKNVFSKQEQSYVLRKSSHINNIRFPMWHEGPAASNTMTLPELSPTQKEIGAEWRRAEGALVYSQSLDLRPEDILQHIVADCSLCASIAVCVNHDRRFHSKIVLTNLKPDMPTDVPYQSKNGIYHFRVLFNGEYRPIDDRLPLYPDGRLMCMTAGSKGMLWPALVEKACITVAGSYDFPGSNSCADLHVLIGWIPEHVDLKSTSVQRERLWSRILDGLTRGYCLLTLGTGEKVTTYDPSSVKLAPIHCYAVIDVQDEGGARQLTMLDSWMRHEDEYVDAAAGDGAMSTGLPSQTAQRFTMSWDTVCNIFDGVYLSWDPGIFRNHVSFHGVWTSSSPSSDNGNRYSSSVRVQLRLNKDQTMQGSQAVWIQLTRHIAKFSLDAHYISLLASSEDDAGYLSGDTNAVAPKGEYTNTTHTLVRIPTTSRDSMLHLIAAYEGDCSDVGFTVTAYSNIDISWVEDPPNAVHTKEVDGAFTAKTAGGNHSYPSFMDNPQYHLKIYPHQDSNTGVSRNTNVKAPTSLVVQGSRQIPMNLTLVWSQGERIAEMGHNEIVATSGPYSFGYAHAHRDLRVGDYTLVVSAFEPQHVGTFKLRVESPLRFDLIPIPQEGAGMFSKVIRDAWSVEDAGGSPSFKKYATNPAYEIRVDTATQLKVRLQLIQASPPTALNISLFQQKLSGETLVATSGPYSDATAGVVTPLISLQPGNYLAVPSTYDTGEHRAYKLLIYSKDAVRISTREQI